MALVSKNKTLLFALCGKIGELSPRPSQVDLLEVVALVALGRKGVGRQGFFVDEGLVCPGLVGEGFV